MSGSLFSSERLNTSRSRALREICRLWTFELDLWYLCEDSSPFSAKYAMGVEMFEQFRIHALVIYVMWGSFLPMGTTHSIIYRYSNRNFAFFLNTIFFLHLNDARIIAILVTNCWLSSKASAKLDGSLKHFLARFPVLVIPVPWSTWSARITNFV